MPSVPADRPGRAGLGAWWPWLAGTTLGLVVLGPALAPGALFNLDLVLTPDIPVPQGVWGLGPELPRRLPFMVPLAWASTVVDGTVVAKALLVAVFAVAFVGAQRLVAVRGVPTRLAAGLLYAASPFLVTRVATGYLGVALAAAVLPWCLPHLLRPSASIARTLLAGAALGACGISGGIFAAMAAGAGLLAEGPGRRPVRVLSAVLVGQFLWLVPGVIVFRQGVRLAGGGDFATRASGLGGPFRVLAGHGFWQDAFQVGHGQVAVALVGAGLLVLAVLGHRDLPAPWRRPAGWLAAAAVGVALASALPGLDTLFERVAQTPVGAPLREGQRLLPLYLVWVAPAAALGVRRLADGVTGPRRVAWLALPLAAATWLALPGLWAAGGQLDPVRIPDEWAQARQVVRDGGGTVVSLPWAQYFNLNVAGARRVNDVMPLYLGGDVLVASDPNLDDPAQERADGRESAMDLLALRVRAGEPVGRQLADLGVRWVVLQHDIDWQTYLSLREDPDLRRVVDGPTLELFEVTGWEGEVVADDGSVLEADSPIAPFTGLAGSGPATWSRPGAAGWLRGLEPASVGADGRLRLPGGTGPVWYWPALVVLVGDLIWLGTVVVAARRTFRESTSVPMDVL